jgi:hypothetical protein
MWLSAASGAQSTQPATPYGQDPSGCDLACNHYLECKGIHDDNLYAQCIAGCQNEAPNQRDAMVQYSQMDCPTAVQIVDSQGGMGAAGGQQGAAQAGPQPGDKECEGCKRWDDQCAYVVETAVGSGPYSGAVSDCPQSCCPR